MMEMKHLSFSYGKHEILHDISLSFEMGKLYVIIGPNGSGKTTLLHALAKLHHADGERILDKEHYEDIARKAFAKKLAILPQERSIPDMSVSELVSAGRFPYLDLSRKLDEEDRKIVKEAMFMTGVERFSQKSMKNLSGGERQRAYIAMLTAQNTPYVLLDEPTSHLDISCTFEVMHLLCHMRDEGKCIIAVLHDLSLALRYADELIVMQNGKIKAIGTPDMVTQSGIVEKVFGVKCHTVVKEEKTMYFFE